MVKLQVKYQQNWHLRDSLLLFVFFNANDDHGTFFKGRIRFLVRSNRLRIDIGTPFSRDLTIPHLDLSHFALCIMGN